ncbi:hypothetical protein KIPE111705_41110 [Kibdelosporangium persicum]|uniref:hypothetical protein n=1 Tax=Kibdelosporangium persicum TaxID=2698649 RepID=UPI001566139C|nr:hypothetical protein [Kibdelosporangium persicum]
MSCADGNLETRIVAEVVLAEARPGLDGNEIVRLVGLCAPTVASILPRLRGAFAPASRVSSADKAPGR